MEPLKRKAISGLPDSTLTDCLFVTGKRGGGKSYSQRIAMERALTKGLRCGWVDSLGIGWGITVAGDPDNLEKPIGPGYNVVVFGGEHGHMPLSPTAGAALGTMLAKAKFSWVVDLKLFKSKAQRVTFMAAFIDAIYENCDSQLLLLMDEVDLWAPQNIIDKQGPAPALLGAMDEIVRRGRIKGISVWMATQRPAVVNKNIISQADGMLAFKTTAPQDTEAVMSWMKAHLKKEQYTEWLAQLSALKKGEAIVYLTEPAISIVREQFPLIATLDTFKPQKVGHAQSDKLGAKPDIEALKNQLGSLEEKLKSEDPKFLAAEISRLKRELTARPIPVAAPNVDTAAIKKSAFDDGVIVGRRQGAHSRALILKIIAKVKEVLTLHVVSNCEHIERELKSIADEPTPKTLAQVTATPSLSTMKPATQKALMTAADLAAHQIRIDDPPQNKGNGAELRILRVLTSRFPARFTMGQWAVLAQMKKTGGTWSTYVSRLRKAGYINENGGTIGATDLGVEAVGGQIEAPQSREEIIAQWKHSLGSGPAKMIDALISVYPNGLTRDDLATSTDMASSGGTYSTYLSRLVSNLVVTSDKQTKTLRMSDAIMDA